MLIISVVYIKTLCKQLLSFCLQNLKYLCFFIVQPAAISGVIIRGRGTFRST